MGIYLPTTAVDNHREKRTRESISCKGVWLIGSRHLGDLSDWHRRIRLGPEAALSGAGAIVVRTYHY
jgi:hypothetical protein